MRRDYELEVDGLCVRAAYDDACVEGVLVPILQRWTRLRDERGSRVVAFLSAPPGTGKTTLAHMLEHLSHERKDVADVQVASLDGFHYHQSYLETHWADVGGVLTRLADVKGTLETFDLEGLLGKLTELRSEESSLWPAYSRSIHDVVDDALTVSSDVVLVEGNWLLSTEGAWEAVAGLADDTVFVSADAPDLRERLVARKQRGGLSREGAELWFERSDGPNIERLMSHHHEGRVKLRMTRDGGYVWDGA